LNERSAGRSQQALELRGIAPVVSAHITRQQPTLAGRFDRRWIGTECDAQPVFVRESGRSRYNTTLRPRKDLNPMPAMPLNATDYPRRPPAS